MPIYERDHNDHNGLSVTEMEKNKCCEHFERTTTQAESVIMGAYLNIGMSGRDAAHMVAKVLVKETIMETEIFDLVITNKWFMERESQLITFKSGNIKSQVDYILTN